MYHQPTGAIKVIDPEFTCYASPGLDLGSLLSGFILAHFYHEQRAGGGGTAGGGTTGGMGGGGMAGGTGGTAEVGLADAMGLIMKSACAALEAGGVPRARISRICADTVGFAMMEVVRTALGCAGARDPAHRIRSEPALERYQRVVLSVARESLLTRHEGDAIHALLERCTTRLDRDALGGP